MYSYQHHQCVGVGNPLSPERTRMLLALRINVLAKGHSGISLETLHAMIQAFNGKPPASPHLSWPGISAWLLLITSFRDLCWGSWLSYDQPACLTHFVPAASCLSFVPEKGTVGASGDLAPLSHLALGLMGEGRMWSPKSGWADARYVR